MDQTEYNYRNEKNTNQNGSIFRTIQKKQRIQ